MPGDAQAGGVNTESRSQKAALIHPARPRRSGDIQVQGVGQNDAD